ncbi:BESS domain-containing protein [Aphis craccivora]|uniref:BESS domain-containing protein n=1 Tax=Aphis craccivora TaxID=307492 RepID=A0A6G0VPP7_APHCR|nr:BESS domain-containing protein [Aphis craccivora]
MWTKLRNCHRDALRRQKKMFKSGAGAEIVKQWKFQKQMEFLLPYMENRKRSANIFDSDDEQSDSADTEISQVLETTDLETQTPILENYYVLEEDNEVHNNKEQEDSVEKLKNTPSTSGMKLIFKEPQKKTTKKTTKKDIGSLIQQSIVNREQRAKERSIERQKIDRLKNSK